LTLATADGRAIYGLFGRIKQAEGGSDGWPAGDAVDILTDWLTGCGFDIEADAPPLP
jgi:hypothetical protein